MLTGQITCAQKVSIYGQKQTTDNHSVEKNPSIKVHRVADPPFFFSPNLSLTLVQSVVHWYCVLVRSRGAVVSFPV